MIRNKNTEKIKKYYNKGYKKYGVAFQRRYPNEELCRFIGRKFSNISTNKRKKLKVLDAGCGSSGNLWMLANEGFKSYGLDISNNSIRISKIVLNKKKLKANLKVGNMIDLPYKNNFFDCVIDIFSSTHLDAEDGKKFLKEVSRVLKKNGSFFSYFPSKESKMFKSKNKTMIDSHTIYNLKEKRSAYKIKNIPFRFLNKSLYKSLLKKNKLIPIYIEEIQKTYFQGNEKFTFIAIEGKKK